MLEDIALGGAGFAVLMNITGVAIPIWNIWNAREHLGLLDLMEQVIIIAIYFKIMASNYRISKCIPVSYTHLTLPTNREV